MLNIPCFEQKPDDASLFTSLAYFSTHSHLAAASEAGDCCISFLVHIFTSLSLYVVISHMSYFFVLMFIPGDVVIVDLATAKDITRNRVDHAGARAVQYTKSGLLVTLGQSNSGQLLLWDPRTSTTGTSRAEMECFQRPLVNSSRGLAMRDKDSYLTCLETHPSNEFEFYSGTSSGAS